MIVAAVGKSGPCTKFIKSSGVASGLSSRWSSASQTSRRLCGGMFVAMPTAMPGSAVDQQVRQAGGEDGRLSLRAVVVVDEVDVCPGRCPGAAARRWVRAALPCSASPRGGHRLPSRSCPGRLRAGAAWRSPAPCGRGRRTQGSRRGGWYLPSTSPTTAALFLWEEPGAEPHALHGIEDAPVHGLQPIAHVGQRAGNDDAHRVVQVRAAHLLFYAYRSDVVAVPRYHAAPFHAMRGVAAEQPLYVVGGGAAASQYMPR